MKKSILLILVLSLAALLAGCGAPDTGTTSAPAADGAASGAAATTAPAGGAAATGGATKITLAAYTTPREAYAEIIPLFREQWKAKTGKDVTFEESYQGSGAQSRAVVEGFDA